ncbi:MAG: transcriptional regulator [Gracilimonas sp.]|uniref:SatD family protein n=1 Tax=Gracilimonas sp. TaxID=1974203 RepID=UPI0019CB52B5|nr:SatD family protein [Gracilimonas sp.]MBD3616124.1 transcriptional regulator [Gracilimonas sp.]
MISVITGDIINSRNTEAEKWLKPLKEALDEIGSSPKSWEIYRGDSFQAEITDPKNALQHVIDIKASVKQVKGIDVRLSIGIGDKTFDAPNITESNGDAFVRSGEGYEFLSSAKQNIIVKSPDTDFDEEINLYLRLLLIAMDNWTPKAAEYVRMNLTGNLKQEDMAKKLGITQSSVSERHKRAYMDEVRAVEERYREQLKKLEL